jgi:hypothetical protein
MTGSNVVVIGLANKVIIAHGLRNSTLEKTIGWRRYCDKT